MTSNINLTSELADARQQRKGNLKIGYARVSTDNQILDMQSDALSNAGCVDIYEEHASGANVERPALGQLLRAVREGDTLVVWRLDRLGRSAKHLIETIENLRKRGVHFQSLTEGIDTGTANGELVFHIFAALAQFERQLISERTKAGLKAARARGRKGGKKPALSARQVKEIKALLSDPDITVTDVAKKYGVGRTTIYKYIKLTSIGRAQ